jgi:hypothetical protein
LSIFKLTLAFRLRKGKIAAGNSFGGFLFSEISLLRKYVVIAVFNSSILLASVEETAKI